MGEKPAFEQTQAADEERKDELWEESRRRTLSLSESDTFWNGNPYAKPIERAGLVVFGLMSLICAILFASIPFQKHFEDGWLVEFLVAFLALLLALKLLRNAFRRDKPKTIATHPDQ